MLFGIATYEEFLLGAKLMQAVKLRGTAGILVVATALFQGCATDGREAMPELAAATSAPVSGYVKGSSNNHVMSEQQDCVRTHSWEPATVTSDCGGIQPSAPVVKAPGSALVSYNGRALFDFDSSALTSFGTAELDRLTAKLNAQDEIKGIEIVGHADSKGSDQYNQVLSESRADAVKLYLQRSLKSVTVKAKGLGESAPIADNSTEAGRRMNRRVEVNIAAMVEQ